MYLAMLFYDLFTRQVFNSAPDLPAVMYLAVIFDTFASHVFGYVI